MSERDKAILAQRAIDEQTLHVYVAGSWAEKERARAWIEKLRAAGVRITHDWTSKEETDNEVLLCDEERDQRAVDCLNGMDGAQVIWILPSSSFGGWAELGYALGRCRFDDDGDGEPSSLKIIVSGPTYQQTIFTTQADAAFDEDAPAFDCIINHAAALLAEVTKKREELAAYLAKPRCGKPATKRTVDGPSDEAPICDDCLSTIHARHCAIRLHFGEEEPLPCRMMLE